MTLLGDAAHPMLPRGSNGAVQAILDARDLADRLAARTPTGWARLRTTMSGGGRRQRRWSRQPQPSPRRHTEGDLYPHRRSPVGQNLHDVISAAELMENSDRYKRISGYPAARRQRRRPQKPEPSRQGLSRPTRGLS